MIKENIFLPTEIIIEDTGDLIPFGSSDESMKQQKEPAIIPILPVRNTVLFPEVVIPVTVGRQKSIKLVKKAYREKKLIGVLTQEKPDKDDLIPQDLYQVGTVAKILKMLVLPDGNTTIIIQGVQRFRIRHFTNEDPFIEAEVDFLTENFPTKSAKETKALVQSLKDAAFKILKLNPEIPQEAQMAIKNVDSPNFLTHFLLSNINTEIVEKQKLLEENDGVTRSTKLLELMFKEIQLLEMKQEINNKVHTDLDQQQREYFLRQQIKVLQDELGYDNNEKDIEDFKAKAAKKKWSETVDKHFKKEVDKLTRLNPMSPEYPIAYNYVELMIDLPWNENTKDNFDLKRAQKILDKDHFGLEKVKDRIIEYLAVLKLKNDMKAPILCLYGPPGVGKTSLGKSIAKALGRKYIRMALGGIRDEAEIRGHRKTYIGAMPGRIIQNIKKSKSSNPVFILDEIDKVATDFRGDPSSALLEALDPEQNNAFADNYLELDYDLSKVLFIATANSLGSIQPALRDRMEIIEVNGYTQEEKLEIAKQHLIPKQLEEHGVKKNLFKITDKAILKVINDYTRESGVRELERKLGNVIRKIAKSIALDEDFLKTINEKDINKLIGAEIFDREMYQKNDIAGVVTGLAWTSVGGEILFIESVLSKGKGKLTISGQLGDVMKESAVAALTYLKVHAKEIGIDHRVFDNFDLHIHVPEGATPKDGPSAGITMLTSLASVFTQRKVKDNLAMTGEITLRGKVLPVGGIKEKILAAKRAGIQEIILCSKNKKDIDEIKQEYVKGLKIHFVDEAREVLQIALMKQKVKNSLDLSVIEDKKSTEFSVSTVS
jgi:ATP-dependent Lon protease